MDKINIILKTPRVFFAGTNDSNSTVGLYDLIKEHVKPNFKIVEIGSFSGVSSELFANFANKIYCVDVWNEYVDSGNSSTLIITKEQLQIAENSFDKMVESNPNVIKIKKTSVEASKDFENDSIDMVYIDSAHDFNTVDEDIKHWTPKVKANGIIAGHDYRIAGVKKAVQLNFPNKKVFAFKDTSWLIYK